MIISGRDTGGGALGHPSPPIFIDGGTLPPTFSKDSLHSIIHSSRWFLITWIVQHIRLSCYPVSKLTTENVLLPGVDLGLAPVAY